VSILAINRIILQRLGKNAVEIVTQALFLILLTRFDVLREIAGIYKMKLMMIEEGGQI